MNTVDLPKLNVAIVGHTNAGKTSLLRTLLRDSEFGEVSDSPGTTRNVTGARIQLDNDALIELFDTPGMEDSIGLLETLEFNRSDHRVDGPELIDRFLASDASRGRFEQEAKALRQLLRCDVALYVIDARDKVLAKYRDELRILGYCARPVVPVLNFVANPSARTNEWREQLARLNMHAVAEFDTVVLEVEGEIHLYEKMESLLDRFRPTLERLIEHRRTERERLIQASAQLIADLLVDVAAYAARIDAENEAELSQGRAQLRDRIRDRERAGVEDLLELHRFRESDYVASPLPVEGGEWAVDLFSQQAIQEYGVRGGGGAAAGAMVGLTIDVMFGGISLGAATAIGAAIGATLAAGQRPGWQLLERLRGRTRLRADESTWMILAARQIDLTHALLHRGHAGRTPVSVDTQQDSRWKDEFTSLTKQLRSAVGRPEWSSIDRQPHALSPASRVRRNRTVDSLTTSIGDLVRKADRQ